jgi:hypothetical protein
MREPLVHFALLGALVLGLHRWVAPPPAKRVEVSADLVEGLRQDYARRTGATPSAAEEAALVQRFVDGEILYREAVALGLDRGDVIVRRRLVQKMEFLLEGMHAAPAPTDADLEAYLAAHADRYTLPARVSLVNVFVSRDRHGDQLDAVAAEVRERLRAGADPAGLGDPFIKGHQFTLQSEAALSGIFGASCAASIAALPAGEWSEPLPSSYGLHIVRVSEHQPARTASLSEVREAVRADLESERRANATRDEIDRLRRQYQVVIAPPSGTAPKVAQAQ